MRERCVDWARRAVNHRDGLGTLGELVGGWGHEVLGLEWV